MEKTDIKIERYVK